MRGNTVGAAVAVIAVAVSVFLVLRIDFSCRFRKGIGTSGKWG